MPTPNEIEARKLDDQFMKVIEKFAPNSYPHLIDTDENDGERFRQAIREALDQAEKRGWRKGEEEESANCQSHCKEAYIDGLIRAKEIIGKRSTCYSDSHEGDLCRNTCQALTEAIEQEIEREG